MCLLGLGVGAGALRVRVRQGRLAAHAARLPPLLAAPMPRSESERAYGAVRGALSRASQVVAAAATAAVAQAAKADSSSGSSNLLEADAVKGLRGFQTKSGLKYFDLVEGTIGESPRYGDLVSFYYTTYYKPSVSDSSLDFIDSSLVSGKKPFLHKHGNGRIIRGIDEALHTMKVGGKRRIIVPKSIGYTELGLGPLPEDGNRRRKLGGLLDLLEKDQGELVFDLELVMVAEDENDQGYYDDVAVSQEEVRQLVLKSLKSNTADFMEKLKKETPPNLFKK